MENFSPPDVSMGADVALELAQKYKHNSNYPYMRELLDIIFAEKNNSRQLSEWYKNIGTYKDEIIMEVVRNNDPLTALTFARLEPTYVEQLFSVMLSNFSAVFAVTWYKNIEYERNYLLKLRAIELGEVELFIQFMKGGYNKYFIEDFYSDIPDESQLGIIL